jgi:Predicted ribosomal protein
MIRAEFFTRADGELTGFRIAGHNGNAGRDIVCAAVSSAAYMAANTVSEVIRADAEIAVEDGYMLVRVAPGQIESCGSILKGFRLHMQELMKQYPKNIQICYTEV